MTNFREILEELEIPTTATAGPNGAAGEWLQLLAVFGQRGFLRALTDGDALALECAPPGDAAPTRKALEQHGWSIAEERVPFVAQRELPSSVDEMRAMWLRVTKLADATRNEDSAAFLSALTASEASEASEAEDAPTGGAFEVIGDADAAVDAAAAPQSSAFEFALVRAGEEVHAALGFSDRIGRVEHDDLEARLISNLRGKYDVDVEAVGAPDVDAKLPAPPTTRVSLKVRAAVGSNLSVQAVERAVGEYLETLQELAVAGVDPLVFLGARSSKRNTGAFEAIGATAAPQAAATEVEISSVELDLAPPGDDDDVDEVVFSAVPTADEPLQPGLFEDERLKRLDATSALVDVVLRHPGYSDRNIGQVMSILLSLDYGSCLEIAGKAPTVITWGVARERALTMKTVLEGAGGRVVLVEPGTFGES